MPRKIKRLGWIPDLPDQRDYLYAAPLASLGALPASVDLRKKCPPVYDQSELGSCHDSETEVLTREGWKIFACITETDKLATVNPETSELIFEHPTRIVRFHYKGVMYRGLHRNLDFKVTPDHKMLVRKWNEADRTLDKNYQLIEMKNLGWYTGLMNSVVYKGDGAETTYTFAGVCHKHKPQRADHIVPMDAFLRFLGIYLAEGTMLKQSKWEMYKIQIAGYKEREKDFIRKTLDDIGVAFLELKDRFTINNHRLYSALQKLGLQGVKAAQKFVPDFVFKLSGDQIKQLLLGHFMGDGWEQFGVVSHCTSSPHLANDLQRLIFLSDGWGSLGSRPPRTSHMKDGRIVIGRELEHRVSQWSGRGGLSICRKENVTEEDYDGEVFCAEVPTYHTLVTRRNGKILISGNCTANAIAGAIEFDQLKQGIAETFTPSRLFIYYNERVMEHSVDSDSGAMIRDGIKSVSKQGACHEQLWPYTIAKFRTKPAQKCYTDAAKHKAVTYQRIVQELNQMKGCLASGYPFVIGFSVYESFETQRVAKTGHAPLPASKEKELGGHAVLCVGYNDARGWFILRNSWGTRWGMKGYFTLPYAYLTESNLADDFWTIRLVQ